MFRSSMAASKACTRRPYMRYISGEQCYGYKLTLPRAIARQHRQENILQKFDLFQRRPLQQSLLDLLIEENRYGAFVFE